MSNERKSILSSVFALAWQLIKRNGFSRSQALKCAWANIKLKASMKHRIVKFYYQKVSGEIREAYGTLKDSIVPPTLGTGRRPNDTLFTYYDTEREAWRSFKRANLINIVTL